VCTGRVCWARQTFEDDATKEQTKSRESDASDRQEGIEDIGVLGQDVHVRYCDNSGSFSRVLAMFPWLRGRRAERQRGREAAEGEREREREREREEMSEKRKSDRVWRGRHSSLLGWWIVGWFVQSQCTRRESH